MNIGSVPYLNALPLWRFYPGPIQLHTPDQLEILIGQKKLDVALLSLMSVLTNPLLLPWHDAGVIQSFGPVESVLVYYNTESPSHIKSIHYTSQSKTSIVLFKILFKHVFGQNPFALDETTQTPDAILRIGDEALKAAPLGYKILDLGEVWTQWTGKPFVYALWAALPEVSSDIKTNLINARKKGLTQISELIAPQNGLSADRVRHYLTKSIQYETNPQSLEGIRLFQKYALEMGFLDKKLPPFVREGWGG